ncbi:MAG: ABC transporter substrate-binding protein [Thermosphaera sp.]
MTIRSNKPLIFLTYILAGILLVPYIIAPIVSITTAQAWPREETVIISSSWGAPVGFNPLLPTGVAWGSTFTGANLVYPRLYVYSPVLNQWIPYLADEITWVSQYSMKITLKRYAYWWDGLPITSEDVKFTMELFKLCPGMGSWIWIHIDTIETPDPYTLVFNFKPETFNLYRISLLLEFLVLPKHRWESLFNDYGCGLMTEFRDDNPEQIVGGGPYKPIYISPTLYAYQRVDNWWGVRYWGLPAPRYVVHPVPINDPQVAMEFQNNNRDTMSHYIASPWLVYQTNPLLGTWDLETCPPCHATAAIFFIAINFKAGWPLNDTEIRRALYYSLLANNKEIIEKINEIGYTNTCNTNILPVPLVPGLHDEYIAWDLVNEFLSQATIENAKAILERKGIIDRDGDGIRELPDGRPFRIKMMTGAGWAPPLAALNIIAERWRTQLGIDAVVETYEGPVVISKTNNGDYEITYGGHIAVWYNPAWPWQGFAVWMDSRLPKTAGSGPVTYYENPDVLSILDQAAKATTKEERIALFRQLQEIWLRDLPALPLMQRFDLYHYGEKYWVGWPNKYRVERFGAWYATDIHTGFVFTLFQLIPAKDLPSYEPHKHPPRIPELIKPEYRLTPARFFELYESVFISPTPTETPATPTIIITRTITLPQTITITTTIPQEGAVDWTSDWTSTIIVAAISVVIGVAIGYFIKRK